MVFDRKMDLLTPFLTQFTYQGQLQENFSLDFKKCVVSAKIVPDEKHPEKKERRLYFYEKDTVFNTIKDFTLDDARGELSNYIRGFREMISELEDKDEDKTKFLKEIVKKKKVVESCKEHLLLAMHVQTVLQRPNNFALFEMEQVKK